MPRFSIDFFTAMFLVIAALLSACGKTSYEQLNGTTMGTEYTIKYQPVKNTHDVLPMIAREFAEIDGLMSTYRADSELSRFNASKEVGRLFPLSAKTLVVIDEARRIHTLTEGYFDITVAPLMPEWGFAPTQNADAPIQTGMDQLIVTEEGLIKKSSGLALDLSAIAKGYAVDQIADLLKQAGVENYLVDIGGEVRVRGQNEQGGKWRVGIADPRSETDFVATLVLDDEALATSGTYWRFREQNGQRHSHLIDPKTGAPVQHDLLSVSVVAASCMTADALATGLGVAGVETALRIAEKKDIPILMLIEENSEIRAFSSSAYQRRFENKTEKQ